MEDTYLRLDMDIAAFLNYLDRKLGKESYLLFLTADHGVAHIPGFLQEHNTPSGVYHPPTLIKEFNESIEKQFSIKNAVKIS